MVVATGGVWTGGTGTYSPNNSTLNATYIPSSAEITAGTITLVLTTTGNGPCPSNSDTVVFTILQPPTAAFTASAVCVNQATYFNDASIVSSGSIVSWSWNFGDASTSTQQNPIHTYGASGTYTVMLVVTSSNGCKDTVLQTVTVNLLPTAAFANTAQCFVDSVYFTDLSSIGSGSITGWSWSFGDATPSVSVQNPAHVYAAPGAYTVTFTAFSNFGCSDTISQTITVQPSPLASFSATAGCLNFPTFFTDKSTILFGTITSWSWNFGDATSSTLQNPPPHTYAPAGTYNVTLIVTSSNGCIDTLVQPMNISPPPGADFVSSNECLNSGTTFIDSSTIYGNNSAWIWNFGDGSSNSSSQNPVHVFPSTGSYPVTLIVTSNQGCIDTIAQVVSVIPSPTAVATVDDNTPTINVNASFNGLGSFSSIVSWYWDFGDSTSASGATPTHSYSSGGEYTVMLIVTSANGCMDTAYLEIIVTLPPRVPSGFSPNGDGNNDMLFVKGGPYKELEFRIYNNWGELIFIGTRQQDGWNGQHSGKNQPIGVYVYTIKAVLEDDTAHDIHGDVTLLR